MDDIMNESIATFVQLLLTTSYINLLNLAIDVKGIVKNN